jgi:tryptophan synthase alpha chain
MKQLQETLLAISAQDKGKRRHPALMTHVVLGYPTLNDSISIVQAMAEGGASLVELQIPFSDPMADGPTIMRANETALKNGVTPRDCMRALETLSRKVSVPLLFMSYYNLLFAYGGKGKQNGLKHFLADAASAGGQGLIVPDLPPEEKQEGYWTLPLNYGLVPIPLVSPLSSPARLKKIAATAKHGFVYCVSTTGTTGARQQLPADLQSYLTRVRKHFTLPLAVGFGISSAQHVRALAPYAEIIVVGSAMINLIAKTSPKQRLAAVCRFTAQLSKRN